MVNEHSLEPRTATIPTPDRDSAPYWAALAEGRLIVQHCRDCGRWTWPVRPLCSGCHGDNLAWEEPKGTGEVYSWVVTHQRYSRDLPVPHTIALVRLDEQDDILIPGIYVLNDENDVEIHQGLRVRVAPQRVNDDVGVLNWTAEQGER